MACSHIICVWPFASQPKFLLSAVAVVTGLSLSIGIGFSGANGAWETKAPAPTKRTEVAAAALDGKIYVIGGFARGIALTSALVEEYNPASDSWRERVANPRGSASCRYRRRERPAVRHRRVSPYPVEHVEPYRDRVRI